MNRSVWLAAVLVLASWDGRADLPVAPSFPATHTEAWINSAPLSLAQLRGQVVLLEFWTFGCSNCRNTLPWLKRVADEYREQGLAVISVHTPEFEFERDPANVRDAVRRLGISYPVMLDPDFEYWNKLENRYWPAFYLVDRRGRIVSTAVGELHTGERRGEEFEARIRAALAAPH